MMKKKKNKRINSRAVGHTYERDLGTRWRGLLDDDARGTSRYLSRALDDAGVDIAGTQKYGLNIQAKRYKNTPPLHATLEKMPKDGCVNAIYWKSPYKGELVIMKAEDFENLFMKNLGK